MRCRTAISVLPTTANARTDHENETMTGKLGLRVVIVALSVGWLAPMWLGVSTLLDFVALELQPMLLQQPKLNSFPFIDFAGRCLAIAFLWLAAALAGWAWVGVAAWQRVSKGR
jgi:hypothetical protein